MRKKLVLAIILFTIVSVFILNYEQPMKYIAKGDGVIEWHTYSNEELV